MAEETMETMIKDAIAELPPAHQEACNELAEHIRRQVKVAGYPVGTLAVALVGTESLTDGIQRNQDLKRAISPISGRP